MGKQSSEKSIEFKFSELEEVGKKVLKRPILKPQIFIYFVVNVKYLDFGKSFWLVNKITFDNYLFIL